MRIVDVVGFLKSTSAIFVLSNVVLLGLLLLRPEVLRPRGGKILVALAFLVLPAVTTAIGLSSHMEHSKTTVFCLSCHVMEPYGKSLLVDDKDHIPAVHFQNRLVPRDHACFTCHTTYTMFGDYRAKLSGLRHLYIYYLGTVPQPIKLRVPFANRECLHCHDGSRAFEEGTMHSGMLDDLRAGKTSCVDCHSTIHDVDHLEGAKMWKQWEDVAGMLTVWDRWTRVGQ
jgi:nitrate/TMAO reductase-like tetraheme cytochrome c subunit